MAKKKNLDPHRMQAIAWRDGEKKEIVVKCLNHPSVLAAMDEASKANTGEMVLWGARKLRELGMAGKLNINEPPLFGTPEEVRNLESRIQSMGSDLEKLVDLVRKMAEMKNGMFECQTKDGKIEISLHQAHEVRVWNGCVITDNKEE